MSSRALIRRVLWAAAVFSLAAALAACANGVRPTDASVGHDAGPRGDASGDAAPVVDGAPCTVGQATCHGVCIDTTSDALDCGRCDNACPAGVGCVRGVCSCYAPMLVCSGACTNTASDSMNCGMCGRACAATEQCAGSTCIPMCAPPNMVCFDPVVSDGGVPPDDAAVADAAVSDGGVPPVPVCADLQTDSMNCGRCGTRCAVGGAICSAGHCMCPAGESSCSGVCADMMTSVDYCGSCLVSCGAGGTCASGVCTACGPTRMSCGGVCADTTADNRNCGSCGHVCTVGETCVAGMCSCGAPRADCGAGCTDLTTDAANCSACGHGCGPGGACVASACTCAPSYTLCGTTCSDLLTDSANCMTCGSACPPADVCMGGTCVVAPPMHYVASMPTAVTVPFVNACTAAGSMTILTVTDDGSAFVSLPFPFRYWATNLPMGAMVNVCSNGWMGMDGVSNASLGGSIPSAITPNAVIAPHWGDLVTRAAGVCVATLGVAPNRRFVVEWNNAMYFAGAGNLTFEVILSEGTGTIDLVYQTMTGAVAETTGIEDQTGAQAVGGCPAAATNCVRAAGARARFTPSP